MGAAPAHVLAVEPDCLVVEAAGRRRRAAMAVTDRIRPGDWVLIDGGAVVCGVPCSTVEVDIAADADLEDERHHYPTEDPETAPAVRHHPPTR
jgi:hypothetical protein